MLEFIFCHASDVKNEEEGRSVMENRSLSVPPRFGVCIHRKGDSNSCPEWEAGRMIVGVFDRKRQAGSERLALVRGSLP